MSIVSILLAGMVSTLSAFPVLDTTQRTDTLNRPLPFHGTVSALGIVEHFRSFTRADIVTVPYRTLDDVLEWRTPAYVLSTGLIGDWNIPLLLGEMPRDQRVVFDGIAAYNVVGLVPPAMIMPEFMERLDILVGAEAAILTGANGGTGYWVQQPWYNTRTPYTRIWYCQSAYDFIATDGVFSQNVAPNLNATLGFRRMVTPGRFPNQWLDLWNTRALLRWNATSDFNISLVHRFVNWGLGTNGGIDMRRSDDPTNERTAVVAYNSLNQRLFRHDLQLLATKADGQRRVLTAGLAVSNEEQNIYRPPWFALGTDSTTHVRWLLTVLSTQLRWEERFDSMLALLAAVEGTIARNTTSDYTAAQNIQQLCAYAYGRWEPVPNLTFRGGIRWMVYAGQLLPIAGIGVNAIVGSVTVRFDAVSSARLASAIEKNAHSEYVRLFLLRAAIGDSTANAGLNAYLRHRRNPIIADPLLRGDTVIATAGTNAPLTQIESGLTIESNIRLGQFRLSPSVVCSFNGGERVPVIYGTASASFRHRIGRHWLRAELFFRARARVHAQRFIPQTWAYIPAEQPQEAAFDGATVALSAELGNAVVKLAMGNVLSSYYATLSTFPQLDRHITLSVAWTFFD